MFAVCGAMWPILSRKMDQTVRDGSRLRLAGSLSCVVQDSAFGSGQTDSIVIPIISVVMCLLTLFTLYKVFQR